MSTVSGFLQKQNFIKMLCDNFVTALENDYKEKHHSRNPQHKTQYLVIESV